MNSKGIMKKILEAVNGADFAARLDEVCVATNGGRGMPVKIVLRCGAAGVDFAIGSPAAPMPLIDASQLGKGIIEPLHDPEPPEPQSVIDVRENVATVEAEYQKVMELWADKERKSGGPQRFSVEDAKALDSEFQDVGLRLQAAKAHYGQVYTSWRDGLRIAAMAEEAAQKAKQKVFDQESRRARVMALIIERLHPRKPEETQEPQR
jgi:hypothetical protein